MSRAATKVDLVKDASEQFEKLTNLINAMPQDEQTSTFDFSGAASKKEAHWQRDKNLRDVLIHLYEWHQLLLSWVAANQNGEEKPFLPAPYNWRTYGQMNVGFVEKHQDTSLEEAKQMFYNSHAAVMQIMEGFTNDELFEKKHFGWTGNSALGSYFVSNTASHYEWALKKLKAHDKIYQKATQGE